MELETRIFADGTLSFDPIKHKYIFTFNNGETIEVRSVTNHFGILGSFNIGSMAARKGMREVFMEEIELNKLYSWQYKKDVESFIKDISKKSADVWKQAALRGSAFHLTMEKYAKGIKPVYNQDESIAKLERAGIKLV